MLGSELGSGAWGAKDRPTLSGRACQGRRPGHAVTQTHASWLKTKVLRSEVQNEAKAKLRGGPGGVWGVWPRPTLGGDPTPTLHPFSFNPVSGPACAETSPPSACLALLEGPLPGTVPSQRRPLSPTQGLGGGGAASGGEDEAQHGGGGGPVTAGLLVSRPCWTLGPRHLSPSLQQSEPLGVARGLEWARSHIFLMLMN